MGYGDRQVHLGEVFELANARNDPLLLKHRYVLMLDPQPTKTGVGKMPKCGECGRVFELEWQRDRCGATHEMTEEERVEERREAIHRKVEERIIAVGS